MEFVQWKPEWLPVVRRQEELLRAPKLSAGDALRLGLIMERLAREKYR